LTSTILIRAVAWSLLIAIVAMTVVPASLRIVTGAPHNVEHELVFPVTGIVFGLGYELRMTINDNFAQVVRLAPPVSIDLNPNGSSPGSAGEAAKV